MIIKINRIKDLGIFSNFNWGDLDNFKNKNLIYGWNYSGKTTLSTLFESLEFKDKPKYFNSAEFQITYKENDETKSIDENSIEQFPYFVKVFNSNYIDRVFTWNQPEEGFSAISFYLGNLANTLNAEINSLDHRIERLIRIRDKRYYKLKNIFLEYNKTNGKFSTLAKEIRDNYLPKLYDQNTLNKSHILTIVNKVKGDLEKYILEAESLDKLRKEALERKDYEELPTDFELKENLETIAEESSSILMDTPPKSIAIPALDEDKELFAWVQAGMQLHKNSNTCYFCSNKLSEKRMDDLNAYYSKKLQETQGKIKQLKEKIIIEKNKLSLKFPNKNELADSLRELYLKETNEFEKSKKKYLARLTTIESDLQLKEQNYFQPISSSNIEIFTLKDSLDKVVDCIRQHNKWQDEFDIRTKKAARELLDHFVADYIRNENYIRKEKQQKHAEIIIKKIEGIVKKEKEQVLEKRAQLSNKVKGQEELNSCLEILLHRNDIQINIANDRFVLERSGHPASKLSEGEKSAIAFSYFLTELKSLRADIPPKLNKTIIYIDDPISSLDSNHIFQIRSLLKTFLKQNDYAQLFVSTHNFEFFSIMYDSGIFSRKKKNENQRPLFFIKRTTESGSVIEKMPKTFSDYKSEYVGIFNILLDFHESEDKENFDYLLLLPNALRRFVELYTLTKYPSTNDMTVDQRIELVFNPEQKSYHNIKLLNWFSHQNQIEKIQQHDDKILQIADAINDLMQYIESEDDLHWKALLKERR